MKINKVVRIFIFSNFLSQAGWGLIGPIFAIFVVQQVPGGSIAMVGLLSAVYWVVKSIAQPFIAHSLDVVKGDRDDFKFLVRGLIVANLMPLGYFFVTHVWQIFILEFIRGLAMSYAFPAWSAIFTRYISEGWEAFSWSIQSTTTGFATGFAAAFGGLLVTLLGFKIVFILTSVFGVAAALVLLLVREDILGKETS